MTMRLAKAIAQSGLYSRREAEKLIVAGHVTVDEQPVSTPAFTVTPEQRIRINGKPIPKKPTLKLYLFYKPKGVLTTKHDPHGRKTIYHLLPPSMQGLIYIGRLDYQSEGLLLLTNDGHFSRQLELPSNKIIRTYRARAHGVINKHKLNQLEKGITIDRIRYAPCSITLEHHGKTNHWLKVCVHEGKNREVRKLLEYAGLTVNRLIRTDYGNATLGKLQPGEYKSVDPNILSIAKDTQN